MFDKIQLSTFNENKDFLSAKGGYGNTPRVWWEETKDVAVNIIQGVFSTTQLAIMSNTSLLEVKHPLLISKRE
jgi:hypothetical protein